MEIASAFVTIRPEVSGFSAELSAALGGETVEVPVGASTDEAQAEIEGLDGGDVEVDVGASTDAAQAEIDGLDGGSVEVEVNANTDAAQEQIGGLGDSLSGLVGGGGGATGALDAFSGAALGAGSAGSIAATGGVAALAAGLGTSVSAAAEAEVAQTKLQAILDTTGASAYTSMDGLMALSTEIQNYSGLSDEAVQGAQAMLLTFTNVNSEAAVTAGVLDDATRAVADISRFMGIDAVQAAGMLGRALDDPVAGTAALRRAKVSFTEAEMASIQAMAEAGDMLGAQQELLRVVENQVGGVAAAYGQTMAGQMDIAKQKIGDAAESIGGALLPALGDLASVLGGAAEGFVDLNSRLEEFYRNNQANVESGPDPDKDPFGTQQLAYWIEEYSRDAGVAVEITEVHGTVVGELGDHLTQAAAANAEFTAAQEAAAEAVAATLPSLGGIIGEVDRAGEAFGVLNASSDPQVIIDNLSLALFAWDDFQANIAAVSEWGPNIAGALQQLGPEVAGGLTDALANGNALVITQLDALITEIEARGGDAAAVLTGFAQNGMSGAVAAVEGAAGPMGDAGTQAGAAGASGIDAGLAFSNASGIGQIVGVQYGAGVSTGVSSMSGTVAAVANSVFAGASISGAFSAGQALGSSYGSGIVAGLASQIGNVTATRVSLDAAAEMGDAIGRNVAASTAPTRVTLINTLDGQTLTERVFDIDRRMALAEGYEP